MEVRMDRLREQAQLAAIAHNAPDRIDEATSPPPPERGRWW